MRTKTKVMWRLATVSVLALGAACGSNQEPTEESPEVAQAEAPSAVANTAADTATADPGGYNIPDSPTWAYAIVASNQKDDLIRYEQKFKDVLGDTDLEAHAIGCDGCAELSSAAPPATLKYVFAQEHPNIFGTFAQAWQETMDAAVDREYRLTFKDNVPGAVCNAPQHPSPCSVWYPVPG